MHILAKEALFVGPIGWFLRNNGVTPVKAGGSDIEAYRVAKAVLDRGEVLCIFPEGTRSPTGVMQEPKPGVAMLATRSRRPHRRPSASPAAISSWAVASACRASARASPSVPASRSRSSSTRHCRAAQRWPRRRTS